MCGKNLDPTLFKRGLEGSPPRVREKLGSAGTPWASTGITPACAGKTDQFQYSDMLVQDHPRVCGKNSAFILASFLASGSHPRVREKHECSVIFLQVFRITPACAGKTYPSSWNSQSSWDHTRVCGKNGTGSVNWKRSIGSHPRVREKPCWRTHFWSVDRDHTRVCGKNHCNSAIHTIYLCAFYVNKADTIADFRKFSQRCFLRSTFFTMIRFPME